MFTILQCNSKSLYYIIISLISYYITTIVCNPRKKRLHGSRVYKTLLLHLLPDYKFKVDVEATTINHLTTLYQLAISVLQLNISVVR